MKLILGVFGSSNRGKSETLILLIRLFEQSSRYEIYMETKPNPRGQKDRIAVFERNGFKVGISSIGDYGEQVEMSTRGLAEMGCDVIVTATRTKGETTHAFSKVAKEFGYIKIWYEKDKSVNRWCGEWPMRNGSFNAMKRSMFNQDNMMDASFLFNYIDSLSDQVPMVSS